MGVWVTCPLLLLLLLLLETQIHPLFSISTAAILVQSVIIFYLNYGSPLPGLPELTCQTAHMIISAPHIFQLHWLKTFHFQDSTTTHPFPASAFFPYWLFPIPRSYMFPTYSVCNILLLPHQIHVLITCKIHSFHPNSPKSLNSFHHQLSSAKSKVSSKYHLSYEEIPHMIYPEGKFLSRCELMKLGKLFASKIQ